MIGTIQRRQPELGGQDEFKKSDTLAMATAINEVCIGWLLENRYLVEGNKIWLGESTEWFRLKGGLPPGDSRLPPFHSVGKILRNMGNHKKCRTFRREFGNANS